jgi:hypothetical protein
VLVFELLPIAFHTGISATGADVLSFKVKGNVSPERIFWALVDIFSKS